MEMPERIGSLTIYDADLKIRSNKDYRLSDDKNTTYAITTAAVSNRGEGYALFAQQVKEGKQKWRSFQLMGVVNPEDYQLYNTKITYDKSIANLTLSIINDRPHVVGFSHHTGIDIVRRSIDVTQDLNTLKAVTFPESMAADARSLKRASKTQISKTNYSIRKIFSEGDRVTVVAENSGNRCYNFPGSRNSNGVKYKERRRVRVSDDLIVASYTVDGAANWIRRIPKKQYIQEDCFPIMDMEVDKMNIHKQRHAKIFSQGTIIGYRDGGVVLLFLDRKSNVDKGESNDRKSMLNYRKAIPMMVTIDSEGDLQRKAGSQSYGR